MLLFYGIKIVLGGFLIDASGMALSAPSKGKRKHQLETPHNSFRTPTVENLGMSVTEKRNRTFGENHPMVSSRICLFSKAIECLTFLNHRNGFAVNLFCISTGIHGPPAWPGTDRSESVRD